MMQPRAACEGRAGRLHTKSSGVTVLFSPL
jgi:hypothetical protein